MKKTKKNISGASIIAIGFLIMILLGTLLLMLPVSSKGNTPADFITALFTATSASCVTGLVLVDTFTQWSIFGQLVLLVLIQVGGLGFITFFVMITLSIRRSLNLRTRSLIKDSISTMDYAGTGNLVKLVVFGTLLVEGTGAILLASRFIPEMGWGKGIYYGIFHSISAFCNAGFDLMGFREPGSSLTYYVDDPVVNITMILLILIGGLGFIVWADLKAKKFRFKKYTLQTKVVLIGATVLVFGGALLFYICEKDNTLADLSVGGKIFASLFGAVTPRTAGFNTVDNGALTESGKLLTIILMFIGGNPGSTAGGAKVTTIFVLYAYVISSLKRRSGVEIYGRRIDDETLKKAANVFMINLTIALSACVVLTAMQGFKLSDTMFEIFSAVSTVGMSAGLTGKLNLAGRLIVIVIMYLGRIGSLSFALSFTDRKVIHPVSKPRENINVG